MQMEPFYAIVTTEVICMTWLDNLNRLRKAQGLSLDDLSLASGVPKGTLAKITSGATRDPKLETVCQLAAALDVSLDVLIGDTVHKQSASAVSAEAQTLARDYDRLDHWGREQVRSVADHELRRLSAACAEPIPLHPPTRIIPLLGSSFAAGVGEPDFGNALEDYEIPTEIRADFAVRVNGDSMEPYLPNGSVALGVKGTPRDGDVAAIMVDGAFYVKQVCVDALGNLYLFSLNRARADLDLTVAASAGANVACFGTIVMEKRLPLPLG